MNQAKTSRVRNPGMDVIRCFALLSVVSVHFFENIGFSDMPVMYPKMFLVVLGHDSTMACVPLFLLLTGALMRKKQLSRNYYRKGIRTLCIYVIASVMCLLFEKLVLHWNITPWSGLLSIFSFNASYYGWYMEMYFGLFLMIPFLNLAYNGLDSKKKKLVLLATGITLTSLPALVNVYNLTDPGFWTNPNAYPSYSPLIPQFWMASYPITYYFVGCYLGEYGWKLKPLPNILLIGLTVLISGSFDFWRSHGVTYVWGHWNQWYSLFNLTLAALIFTFFQNLQYEHLSGMVRSILAKCSDLALGAYLLSLTIELPIYPRMNNLVPSPNAKFFCYFLVVPMILIGSLALSWVADLIYRGGKYLFSKLHPAIQT